MKDRLEDFVNQNKDQFDMFEPSDEVWNRINKNIPKPRIVDMKWVRYTMRAAGVAIIFSIAFSISEMRHNSGGTNIAHQESETKTVVSEQVIPELKEAEVYYTSQINNKLNRINKYTSQNPELQEQIQIDFNELDVVLSELKKDLKDNIANDEVIEAMIQNYRTKVRILEQMLDYLEKSDNKNKTVEKRTDI